MIKILLCISICFSLIGIILLLIKKPQKKLVPIEIDMTDEVIRQILTSLGMLGDLTNDIIRVKKIAELEMINAKEFSFWYGRLHSTIYRSYYPDDSSIIKFQEMGLMKGSTRLKFDKMLKTGNVESAVIWEEIKESMTRIINE